MRILFTFVGGNGHFEPLIPIAKTAKQARHVVAVAGRHSMVRTIQAAGFVAFATGTAGTGTVERIPLKPLDLDKEDRDMRDGFADRAARSRFKDVSALAAEWQSDVIVCD